MAKTPTLDLTDLGRPDIKIILECHGPLVVREWEKSWWLDRKIFRRLRQEAEAERPLEDWPQ